MTTFNVTVKVEGRKPWATTVEAPDAGKARTRAVAAYCADDANPPLRGDYVEYDVKEMQR